MGKSFSDERSCRRWPVALLELSTLRGLLLQPTQFSTNILYTSVENTLFYSMLAALGVVFVVVKGSARQGGVVYSAPTDQQKGPPNGGIVGTLLPIKLLSLASPSTRHLD